MDVALHRLPVTFVLDRAGITGADGPSHNGMWDLAILQVVPGPADRRAPRRGPPCAAAARGAGVDDGPTVCASPRARAAPTCPRCAPPEWTVLDVLAAHRRGRPAGRGGRRSPAWPAGGRPPARRTGHRRARWSTPRWVQPVPPALVDLAAAVRRRGHGRGRRAHRRRRRDPGARRCATPAPSTRELHTLGVPSGFLEHGLARRTARRLRSVSDRIAEQVTRAVAEATGRPPLKGAV